MGRPQRRSTGTQDENERRFEGEEEPGQSHEIYVSDPMYPLLQYGEDDLMDIRTSDGILSMESCDADAARTDTAWPPKLSLTNDGLDLLSPSSYVRPEFLDVLNQ